MSKGFDRAQTVADVSGEYWAAVTLTSDVSYTGRRPRAIYVGTTGDIVMTGDDDVSVTFANVPDGTLLPVSPKTITSTNTTATDIVAIW